MTARLVSTGRAKKGGIAERCVLRHSQARCSNRFPTASRRFQSEPRRRSHLRKDFASPAVHTAPSRPTAQNPWPVASLRPPLKSARRPHQSRSSFPGHHCRDWVRHRAHRFHRPGNDPIALRLGNQGNQPCVVDVVIYGSTIDLKREPSGCARAVRRETFSDCLCIQNPPLGAGATLVS